MKVNSTKRLTEIKNEFERGIFTVLYNSPKQKFNRSVAASVLVLKHILRGLLFSWPLYLLALAAYSIPQGSVWLVLLLLLPAMYISWAILNRGIREDYENLIDGYLLRSGYIGRIIFYGKR
jgi:TctA family transporter